MRNEVGASAGRKKNVGGKDQIVNCLARGLTLSNSEVIVRERNTKIAHTVFHGGRHVYEEGRWDRQVGRGKRKDARNKTEDD